MSKLRLWQEHPSWQTGEKEWEAGAAQAAELKPLKKLDRLPQMVGITPEAAKNLKWKSLKWIVQKDKNFTILKNFLKHPLKYGWGLAKSMLKGKPYIRQGDFFLYGVDSTARFEALLQDQDKLFIIGFSYCHKPFECPSGRFTDQCIHDPQNPVCRQCFIGKCVNALPPKNNFPVFIPTIHYIGEKIFEIVHSNPEKEVVFLITACEMTLEMFGDLGNMVGIKGIGVRLGGRICNTMKAFEFSEEGIKPGLTVVLEGTQKHMLEWIKLRGAWS
jgi:hypothetical protein